MTQPLIYANNIDLKYPLSDFHTEDVPNSILMNLSLSIQEDLVPVVSVIRVQNDMAYLCIENESDGSAIATVLVENPSIATVYPLSMDIQGFGWVTWGTGAVEEEYYSGSISAKIDPECVTALKQTAPVYDISVNGVLNLLQNSLGLGTSTDRLNITVEGNNIYFDRNDDAFSSADLVALTEGLQSSSIDTLGNVLLTINGVPPDENGNIDIVVTDCIESCEDGRSLTVPRGDTGAGEVGELPLDIFAGDRKFLPDDPCSPDYTESSSMPSGSSGGFVGDVFEGCTPIGTARIIATGKGYIGTVYTDGRLF